MQGHASGEQLAQLRPSGVTAEQLFAPDQIPVEITLIVAAVISGTPSAVDVSVYHDDDGTTYDDDALIYLRQLSVYDDSIIFQAQHPGGGIVVKPGGSLGVKINDADAVNFTIYGVSAKLAERVRPRVN